MADGTIRGRFAPSPSGYMHLGNAWSALLAWLSVRAQGGVMVLRLEDLDPDRCRRPFCDAVEEGGCAGWGWTGMRGAAPEERPTARAAAGPAIRMPWSGSGRQICFTPASAPGGSSTLPVRRTVPTGM